jgi:Toprim domain-containing protein
VNTPQKVMLFLYIATGGGISPGTISAIKVLLHQVAPTPGATLVIATDADGAGCGYAKWLTEMADEAGVQSERLMCHRTASRTGTRC